MVTHPVMAIIATLRRLNWRTVVAVTYGRVHWNSVTMSTIGEFRCGVRVVVLHNPTLPDNGPPYPCFGEGIDNKYGMWSLAGEAGDHTLAVTGLTAARTPHASSGRRRGHHSGHVLCWGTISTLSQGVHLCIPAAPPTSLRTPRTSPHPRPQRRRAP